MHLEAIHTLSCESERASSGSYWEGSLYKRRRLSLSKGESGLYMFPCSKLSAALLERRFYCLGVPDKRGVATSICDY